MVKLFESDCEKIDKKFKGLNCELHNQRIWGTLKFSCYYDRPANKLIYEKSPNALESSYEVEIAFNERHLRLPKVYETSNIIQDYALKTNIELIDLHMFSDGSCCLGIYPEDVNISAFEFLLKRVLPFFYWHTHFRSFGEEPWKAFSHGKAGYREKLEEIKIEISDNQELLTNKVMTNVGTIRNKTCQCGSNKKYKNCCLVQDECLRSKIQELSVTKNLLGQWLYNNTLTGKGNE